MIDKRNILAHELVGQKAVVEKSLDQSHVGVEGTIVDETRNTIVMEMDGRELRLQKKGTRLKVLVNGGITIDCSDIMFRPEDRIKRCLSKRRKDHGRRRAA